MDGTPLQSGNILVDGIFNLCVEFLLWLAHQFGVSYNTINIWIFCVIWPLVTAMLVAIVILQHLKIRRMREEFDAYNAIERDMADFQSQRAEHVSGTPNAKGTGSSGEAKTDRSSN